MKHTEVGILERMTKPFTVCYGPSHKRGYEYTVVDYCRSCVHLLEIRLTKAQNKIKKLEKEIKKERNNGIV